MSFGLDECATLRVQNDCIRSRVQTVNGNALTHGRINELSLA